MSMLVYTWMYMCKYMCVSTHKYVCECEYVSVYMHVCVGVYMHVCKQREYIQICICECEHVSLCVNVYTGICECIMCVYICMSLKFNPGERGLLIIGENV